jgi:hypothetical protein
MVLKEDAQIVFVENFDPIAGAKVRWFENENLRALGVNLHPEPEQPPAQLVAPKQAAASAPRKKRSQEAAQPVREKATATVASNTTPKPAPPAAPETVEPHVVDRQEYGDTVYTMYSDGSIGMTTPSFSHRFASRDELTAYLDSLRAPAQE